MEGATSWTKHHRTTSPLLPAGAPASGGGRKGELLSLAETHDSHMTHAMQTQLIYINAAAPGGQAGGAREEKSRGNRWVRFCLLDPAGPAGWGRGQRRSTLPRPGG